MLQAFAVVFGWPGILYVATGIPIGLIFGILPGLGGVTAIILLTPFTFKMDPKLAIVLLTSAYGCVTFGGTIPAILINTPGMAPNAATCFDGFPLTQQGKGAVAIGASATSSAIGGILGLIYLVFLIPVVQIFILSFSYPEFFLMVLWGITLIAAASKGNTLKGLIAGFFGILLALIGQEPMTGIIRYSLGFEYLWDGIQIVPAFIGLLGVSSAMALLVKGESIVNEKIYKESMPGVMEGVKAALRNIFLIIRSSFIGMVVGFIPGVGGAAAAFIAYTQAKQTCKNSENFGKGDIRGVIAPESSNDAKDGGALLPTLAFGIPGSEAMAVLLAALTLHGIPSGPEMLDMHMDLIWVIIVGVLVSHIFGILIVLPLANRMMWITRVRAALLSPIIFVVCFLGAYAIRNQIWDVVAAMLFGFLGYFMLKYDFSRVTLVIGLILGELTETTFLQTLKSMGIGVIFTRPISIALVIAILGTLFFSFTRHRSHEKNTV